eukprot:SAG11_NODE_21985_length_414_cov_1.384127_1_plen_100_part_10
MKAVFAALAYPDLLNLVLNLVGIYTESLITPAVSRWLVIRRQQPDGHPTTANLEANPATVSRASQSCGASGGRTSVLVAKARRARTPGKRAERAAPRRLA